MSGRGNEMNGRGGRVKGRMGEWVNELKGERGDGGKQ